MAVNSSARRAGEGFSAEVRGWEARRQLRLSFSIVVMLALCIVTAAASVGHRPLAAKRNIVSVLPTVTLHAEADPVGARAI